MIFSRLPRRAGRTLAVAGSTLLLGGSIAVATGRLAQSEPAPAPAAPVVSLTDNDGDQPLFSLAGMIPGDTATSCIAVTNEGTVPVDVDLSASAVGGLEKHLRLQVERGAAPAPRWQSCTGFVKDGAVWGGGLDTFAEQRHADGKLAVGETRMYRYTVTLREGNTSMGMRSEVSFGYSAGYTAPPVETPTPGPGSTPGPTPGTTPDTNLGATPGATPGAGDPAPGEACTSYEVAGGRLRATVALRKRGGASLVVRQVGTATARRLLLTGRLTSRRGKTIPASRLSRVTYLLNGKPAGTAKRSPFSVRMAPTAPQGGTNLLQVRFRDRNRRATRVTFKLTAGQTVLDGTPVCVIQPATPTKTTTTKSRTRKAR